MHVNWYRAICRGWLLYSTSQVACDSPSVSFGGIGAASLSPKGGKWQGIAYGWTQIARLCLKSKMEHQYFVVISNTNMRNAIFQTSIVCICLFYHVPYRSRFQSRYRSHSTQAIDEAQAGLFSYVSSCFIHNNPNNPQVVFEYSQKTPRNGMSCNTYIILYVYNRLQ